MPTKEETVVIRTNESNNSDENMQRTKRTPCRYTQCLGLIERALKWKRPASASTGSNPALFQGLPEGWVWKEDDRAQASLREWMAHCLMCACRFFSLHRLFVKSGPFVMFVALRG